MNASPPNPFSTRRVVSLVIIAALGGLTILLFIYDDHQYKRYEGWETAEPVRMAVDLSRPGVYSATLVHTFPKAELELLLQYEGAYVDPDKQLASLRVRYEVVDDAGTLVDTGIYLTPRGMYARRGFYDHRLGISLVELPPFPKGTYTLRVTVTNPAWALTDKAQTIVARYQLWKSDVKYPMSMYGFCGMGLLVVAICVLYVSESYSRNRQQHQARLQQTRQAEFTSGEAVMCASHRSDVSTGRMVHMAIVLGLCGLFVVLSYLNYQYGKRYKSWMTAEPVRLSVDLSRPGVYEAPLVQTTPKARSELRLQYEGLYAEPKKLLAGLNAQIQVVDAAGVVVETVDFPRWFGQDQQGVWLAELPRFKQGSYTLRVTVSKPAPALTGSSQFIVARYLLSGSGVDHPIDRDRFIMVLMLLASGFNALTGKPGWWRPQQVTPPEPAS